MFTQALITLMAEMELYLQRVIRVIWERTTAGQKSYLLIEEERVDERRDRGVENKAG